MGRRNNSRRKTTVYLGPVEFDFIAEIKQRWKIKTNNGAIRAALRYSVPKEPIAEIAACPSGQKKSNIDNLYLI